MRATERRRYAEALGRIKARLDRDFPVGCTVRMTAEAVRQWPRYKGRKGKVVGHYKGVSPMVLFEHRKTPDSWHPGFLERVKR